MNDVPHNVGATVPYIPYPVPVPVPQLTGTTCCIALDEAWVPYIVGCAKALANTSTWRSTDVSIVSAVVAKANQLLDDLMSGCNCEGPTGATGAKGDTGDTGSAGSNGSNGSNGTNGVDGVNGRGVSISNGTITSNPGSLSLTLTADLPTVGSTIDNYVLTGNIPPNPVYTATNTSQDAALPDTLSINPTTHVIDLLRPGSGYVPPHIDGVSTCDVSEAISNDLLSRFDDVLNAYDAAAATTSYFGTIIADIVGSIPLLGGLGAAIVACVTGIVSLTSAVARAEYTTDVKNAIKMHLYCVMSAASTLVFDASIQSAFAGAVLADDVSIADSIFRTLYSDFILALDPSKVNAVGTFAAIGSGDCSSYDCGGGGGGWTLAIPFTAGLSGYTVLNQFNDLLDSNGIGYSVNDHVQIELQLNGALDTVVTDCVVTIDNSFVGTGNGLQVWFYNTDRTLVFVPDNPYSTVSASHIVFTAVNDGSHVLPLTLPVINPAILVNNYFISGGITQGPVYIKDITFHGTGTPLTV